MAGKDHLKANYLPERSGEIRRMVMAKEKAKVEIGFTYKYSFAEGIKETLAYYKD